MTIFDNCGNIPPLEINPETGVAVNAAVAVTLLFNYVSCMQSATDGEISGLKLDIQNLGTSLISQVGNMIAVAIAQSESQLRAEINSAVDGVRSESQQADSNLQNQITANNNSSNQSDVQLFNYIQSLHNQQQGYIDQQDNNILNQAVGYVDNQIDQIGDVINATYGVLSGRIDDVGNVVSDVVGALGKFIDDPLGWLLKFLQYVFIPWVQDEIGTLIAPDKDSLPPRENYEDLFELADLI